MVLGRRDRHRGYGTLCVQIDVFSDELRVATWIVGDMKPHYLNEKALVVRVEPSAMSINWTYCLDPW